MNFPKAIVLSAALSFLGVVAFIPLRFVPVGDVGILLVGPLFSVVTLCFALAGSKGPGNDAGGLLVVGAVLGVYLGFLEAERRRRCRGGGSDPPKWRY